MKAFKGEVQPDKSGVPNIHPEPEKKDDDKQEEDGVKSARITSARSRHGSYVGEEEPKLGNEEIYNICNLINNIKDYDLKKRIRKAISGRQRLYIPNSSYEGSTFYTPRVEDQDVDVIKAILKEDTSLYEACDQNAIREIYELLFGNAESASVDYKPRERIKQVREAICKSYYFIEELISRIRDLGLKNSIINAITDQQGFSKSGDYGAYVAVLTSALKDQQALMEASDQAVVREICELLLGEEDVNPEEIERIGHSIYQLAIRISRDYELIRNLRFYLSESQRERRYNAATATALQSLQREVWNMMSGGGVDYMRRDRFSREQQGPRPTALTYMQLLLIDERLCFEIQKRAAAASLEGIKNLDREKRLDDNNKKILELDVKFQRLLSRLCTDDTPVPELVGSVDQRQFSEWTLHLREKYKSLPAGLHMKIPLFSIITGVNGVGKTQLLECIHDQFQSISYKINAAFLANISNMYDSTHGRELRTVQLYQRSGVTHTESEARAGILDTITPAGEQGFRSFISFYWDDYHLVANQSKKPEVGYIWEILNALFRRFGLDFSIEPEKERRGGFHIFFKKNGVEIELSSLSSGELALISIISWLAVLKRDGSTLVKACFLLDEVDIHFHPEFTVRFFDVMREITAQGNGNIRVVMTTHNPATVNLAPEEATILIMQRDAIGQAVLEPAKSRRYAISILSSGLLTVVDDINYVLVENKDDARFYTMAYRKFFAASFLATHGSRLIFAPVGVKMVNTDTLVKLDVVTKALEIKGADKDEVEKLKTLVNELKGRNDRGGGCQQVRQRVTIAEYKMDVNQLGIITETPEETKDSHQPEMTWGLLDRDESNKSEGSIRVIDVYSFENYLCMPLNLFYLMKKDAEIIVVKQAKQGHIIDRKAERLAKELGSTADRISDFVASNKLEELRKLITQLTSYVINQLIERINLILTTTKEQNKDKTALQELANLEKLHEGLQGKVKPLKLANGLVIEKCPVIFFDGISGKGGNGHKLLEAIEYLLFRSVKDTMHTRIFGAFEKIPAALIPKGVLTALNRLVLSKQSNNRSKSDGPKPVTEQHKRVKDGKDKTHQKDDALAKSSVILKQEDKGKNESKGEDDERSSRDLGSNLAALFSKLARITEYAGQGLHSDSWATGYGINQCLEKLLGDKVHIVDPDTSSVASPVDTSKDKALEGVINYVKMIGSYYTGDELIKNGFIHKDGGTLKKPVVMIWNTSSIKVTSNKATAATGGNHWQTCVILPKNYTTPLGIKLNNGSEIIFFIDSLYDNRTIPENFKQLLAKSIEYSFDSEGQTFTHKIGGIFPKAQFINCVSVKQQSGGEDCGWWAVYNALMLVLTGKEDFLGQFRERSRKPGYALRVLLPSLDSEIVMGNTKAAAQKKQEGKEERISTLELYLIQRAIEESLRGLTKKGGSDDSKKGGSKARDGQNKLGEASADSTSTSNDNSSTMSTTSGRSSSAAAMQDSSGKKDNLSKSSKASDVNVTQLVSMAEDHRETEAEAGASYISTQGSTVTFSSGSYVSQVQNCPLEFYQGSGGNKDHIKSIKFPQNQAENSAIRVSWRDYGSGKGTIPQYPTLFGMQKWDNIPELVLITGENGIGKSNLLNFVHMTLNGVHNKQVFYLGAYFNPQDNGSAVSYAESVMAEERSKSNPKSVQEKLVVPKWDLEDPEAMLDHIFTFYKTKELEARKIASKATLRLPWDEINKILDDSNELKGFKICVSNKKDHNGFYKWHLTKAKANNGRRIDFNNLSSGQVMILSAMTWQYLMSEREPGQGIKYVLFDEPDKHFDPKLGKRFLRIVSDIFLRYGVQVFMITHNLATVALAGEMRIPIYIMCQNEHGVCKVEPAQSTRHAISVLSDGMLAVVKDQKYVMVEADDDVKFYTILYLKLLASSYLSRKSATELIFVSSAVKPIDTEVLAELFGNLKLALETMPKDQNYELIESCKQSVAKLKEGNEFGGGSQQVEKRVKMPQYEGEYDENGQVIPNKGFRVANTKHTSEMIWGLLDGDRKRRSEGTLLAADVYSIENYLCMPINLFYLIQRYQKPADDRFKRLGARLESGERTERLVQDMSECALDNLKVALNDHSSKRDTSEGKRNKVKSSKLSSTQLSDRDHSLGLINGMSIKCPKVFINERGHDLQSEINFLIFGERDNNQMKFRLFNVLETMPVVFLPKHLLDTFQALILSKDVRAEESKGDREASKELWTEKIRPVVASNQVANANIVEVFHV